MNDYLSNVSNAMVVGLGHDSCRGALASLFPLKYPYHITLILVGEGGALQSLQEFIILI